MANHKKNHKRSSVSARGENGGGVATMARPATERAATATPDGRGRGEQYRRRTRLIHGSFATGKWDYDHHVVPPESRSATFRLSSVHRGAEGFAEFGSAVAQRAPIYIYDRLDEPTRGMLEENLAVAESGEMAIAFSSGMAAISAALCASLANGKNVLSHHIIYGCTHSLMTNWLPRYGMAARFCDLSDPRAIERHADRDTRVVYFETPVNPTMELIDIAAVRKAVDRLNAKRREDERIAIIVDNTFATPYCQRPLELGADIVVHSLTKDIGGFGTDMGGAVIGPERLYHHLMLYRKDFGGVLSPRNAWSILVYGLPTLATRVVNQQKAAIKVAEFLLKQPKVERVIYPGLPDFAQSELAQRQMIGYDGKFAPGSMLYFELGSTTGTPAQAAERFVDYIAEKAYTITLAVSLGQIKTLIEHPYSMTHATVPEEQKLTAGVHPSGIRLSLGLEDWHDIIHDLQSALAVV
jgi:cystathionine beta-lyase/cystathionine gamma-synthase